MRILISKTRWFDFITEYELMLMTTPALRMVVNLPRIIAHQMQEEVTSRHLCLPYGMGLTIVFQAYGISLVSDAFKELFYIDTYDDRSLHHIGYWKIGGRWVHRGSSQEVEPDSEDEFRDAEAGLFKPVPDDDAEAE